MSSAGGEAACVLCGHCAAVCPQGAISIVSLPESLPEIQFDRLPAPEQVEQLLRARRSIRSYKDAEVGRPLLARLLDTVRYAPSGLNRQPVQWIVVSGAGRLKELSSLVIEWMQAVRAERPEMASKFNFERLIEGWNRGRDPILRGAPHLALAHGAKVDTSASGACTIAGAHLELLAASFGLGACWAGYFNLAATSYAPLRQALGVPEDRQPCGALMIGYPKYRYRRVPARREANVVWR